MSARVIQGGKTKSPEATERCKCRGFFASCEQINDGRKLMSAVRQFSLFGV